MVRSRGSWRQVWSAAGLFEPRRSLCLSKTLSAARKRVFNLRVFYPGSQKRHKHQQRTVTGKKKRVSLVRLVKVWSKESLRMLEIPPEQREVLQNKVTGRRVYLCDLNAALINKEAQTGGGQRWSATFRIQVCKSFLFFNKPTNCLTEVQLEWSEVRGKLFEGAFWRKKNREWCQKENDQIKNKQLIGSKG